MGPLILLLIAGAMRPSLSDINIARGAYDTLQNHATYCLVSDLHWSRCFSEKWVKIRRAYKHQ